MRTVHIGIRHDDDFVIAQFGDIEILVDSGAESGNHRLNFRISVDAIHSRLLYIQDFTAERQNSLGLSIACGLRRTACRISLDNENFAFLRILTRAIRQLSGQRHAVQCGFSAR